MLFEQRSKSGGIWNYTGHQTHEDLFTIPQTDPRGKTQTPTWREPSRSSSQDVRKEATFVSPVYDKLETNIPRDLMRFQDLDWPASSQLFPKHETVLTYIQSYALDVSHLIRYETQITSVSPIPGPSMRWTITSLSLRSSTPQEEDYDAVIVANGHFIVPYIPSIPGIEAFNKAHPGVITHAKYYRAAEDFTDKKVVVVGASASGTDISTQIAPHCATPLLWCSTSPPTSPSPLKSARPQIARFLPETCGVEFADGSTAQGVDAVLFATGYLYSLPFLEGVEPRLITDGTRVENTYEHLFYAPRPTLALLTLPQRIIPFPIAEAQAAVLARVYAGRLALPSLQTMRDWDAERVREVGDGRGFHLLPFPRDGEYINMLAKWAGEASTREGLENGGTGKTGLVWGEREFWCREAFPRIRAAFSALGEKRFGVRTLEEVGFRFEEMGRDAR